MSPPNDRRFFVGLDLGCTHDFTALAVLDRPRVSPDSPVDARYPAYSLRHLQRFHLGTPYTEIVPGVVKLLQAPVLAGCTLVVDMTGVGRPVVDMLDQAMRGKLTCQRIAVTITGGQAVRSAGNGCVSVPKRELIAGLQVLLQTRRLRIARSLPEAEVLTKELENYRVKITAAGNEAFDAWRSNQNDDTVLATALAAWVGEQAIPKRAARGGPAGPKRIIAR